MARIAHVNDPSYTSKEKHFLTRKLVGYRNWRHGCVKRKGTRFWEKKNETKILYFG